MGRQKEEVEGEGEERDEKKGADRGGRGTGKEGVSKRTRRRAKDPLVETAGCLRGGGTGSHIGEGDHLLPEPERGRDGAADQPDRTGWPPSRDSPKGLRPSGPQAHRTLSP